MRLPRAAKARAMPSPIPLVDPVTSATFFSKTGLKPNIIITVLQMPTLFVLLLLLLLLLLPLAMGKKTAKIVPSP